MLFVSSGKVKPDPSFTHLDQKQKLVVIIILLFTQNICWAPVCMRHCPWCWVYRDESTIMVPGLKAKLSYGDQLVWKGNKCAGPWTYAHKHESYVVLPFNEFRIKGDGDRFVNPKQTVKGVMCEIQSLGRSNKF